MLMKKPNEVINYELTWDRLDLAFELCHLDLIGQNRKLAEEIYSEHSRAQLESIIHHIGSGDIIFDYKFYQERSVDEGILDSVVTKFIEYSSDIYIAFLWPAGKGFKDEVDSMFTKIVYKKDIKLTPTGAFNLMYELYKPREWLGNKSNKYKGTKVKVVECFPDFDEFTVIVFQSDSIEDVIRLKAKVRLLYNIQNSCIHTTDNKEEGLRISRLLLNENGRHFLNYSKMAEFEFFSDEIELIKNSISDDQIKKRDMVLDSDTTLALYGIKDFKNINYLNGNREKFIYDPSYYFYYFGIKFTSFKEAYDIKTNRNEEEDKKDIMLMDSLIMNTAINYKTIKLRHRLIYMKIICKIKIVDAITKIFKSIGLYKMGRAVYHKIKE